MGIDTARLIIIGAGVTGLLAAVAGAQAGHRVTVLDRGPIPNPASTSYDQHRVVRAIDPDDPEATRRAARADRRWRELEQLFGDRFYRRVGVLAAWPADRVEQVLQTAAAAGVAAAVVDPADYPYLGMPAATMPVVERGAGVLLADRALGAAARWLRRHPAVTLRPGETVRAVEPGPGRVSLASGATLEAELILVAAGPWSPSLVDTPTVLYRQIMVYLRPPADLLEHWNAAPAAGRLGCGGDGWLMPPGAGTLLKLSSAAACREVAPLAGATAADAVLTGEAEPGEDMQAAARILAASIVTGVDRYSVVKVARCHYAVDAETGAGRVTSLGPRVWARAASGGDGFRTAPLVADELISQLDNSHT